MPRLSRFAPALALTAALLITGPALSALRLGTDSPNPEVLTGTKGNDHITGADGPDTLIGKAGNDTYFFADGWGDDILIEKPGEGTDTLNFHGVHTGAVAVVNVREWSGRNPAFTRASGPGGLVTFGTVAGLAVIEKIIGGQGNGDAIIGGGGPHMLMPGGGTFDSLEDRGGWNDGAGGLPEIPASNDTYKGFAGNTGMDLVFDYGGTKDVVDMRPFSTEDVYLSRRNFDGNGTLESLQIVTSPTTQIILVGHFEPYLNLTSCCGQQGRIEKVIFTDATFTTSNGLAAMTAAVTATSGKQARLADAADRLAEEARALMAELPGPGAVPGGVSDGAGAIGPGPGGEPDKHRKADKKRSEMTTQAKKDEHEKEAKKPKKPRPWLRQHPPHRAGWRSG